MTSVRILFITFLTEPDLQAVCWDWVLQRVETECVEWNAVEWSRLG